MTVPTSSIRVGGEIDAHCNKCELNLAHTILAMVGTVVKRVQCNTCGSQHMYRGEQPLVKATSFAAPKRASAPRTPRAETKVVTFDEVLKGKDLTRAKKYSIRETYVLDDVIDHLTFGFGIHFCLGAPLARLEGQACVAALLERFPRLARGAGEPQWLDAMVMRGLTRLPLRLA